VILPGVSFFLKLRCETMKCDNCNTEIGKHFILEISTFHYADASGESGYCLCTVCGGKIKRLLDGGKL
jgi:hypothetical protein